MVNLEELELYNPWWKTGKVKEEWLKEYKRKLYYELLNYLDKRQIILIQGLRRMGKTTLLFQIINELLYRGVPPRNILYFSFDDFIHRLEDVLDIYQKFILKSRFEEIKTTIYVFLDELQKLENWEEKLKVLYDIYPNIKFIVSGSSSITLKKKSKESLAGRVIDFTLLPLDFEEFLEINGYKIENIKENPYVWKKDVVLLLYRYLKYGSFPELAKEENEEFARRYILNSVIERIIYKDILQEFKIRDVELLKKILYILGHNPGMIVNFKELSKNLGRDERTISNYFEYLEYGLIIKFVYNYRGSPLASMRKLKKVYFTTPNFIFALNPNFEALLPKILENLVASLPGVKYFYKDGYEIDFILENEKVEAIEVKWDAKKLRQIKKLINDKRFVKKIEKYYIVDFEKEDVLDGIPVVPVWKLLLKLI